MKRVIWLVALLAVSPQLARAQSWTVSGHLVSERHFPTTVVLNDGRVLIAGSLQDSELFIPLQSVEIHNPASGLTVEGPPLPEPRAWSAAVTLPDGRAAVIGGVAEGGLGGDPANTNYLFNPATNAWSTGAPMHVARNKPHATVLPNGRVLVFGGAFPPETIHPETASAEIYDPATNTWTLTGSPQSPHLFGAITTLVDGRVLVAGGQPEVNPEIYDPVSGTWSSTGPLPSIFDLYGSLVSLPDGRVISAATLSGVVAIFNPIAGTWSEAAPMPTPTALSGAALLPDGRALFAGGIDINGYTLEDLAITQIYDPVSGSWSAGPSMNDPHGSFSLLKLPNGALLAAGSYASSGITSIEVFGAPQIDYPAIIDTLRSEIAALQGLIDTMQQENHALHGENAALHSDIATLHIEIATLRAEIARLRAAEAELQILKDAISKLNHGQRQALFKLLGLKEQ